MALEATFRTLSLQLRKHCDLLNVVLLTVGDKPPDRGAALADELENSLLDMVGLVEDAHAAACVAEKAMGPPLDMDRAKRALGKCQELFHRLEQQFWRVVSYQKLKDLQTIGHHRGGEWKPWAASMKDALEQGREPLEESSRAIAACWQELVEHSGNTTISVTNTGQRMITRGFQTSETLSGRVNGRNAG
jgi:hypothetical protein